MASAADPLTPRQRLLVENVRRRRPFVIGLAVVGAVITIPCAVYSINGLQELSAGAPTDVPRVPRHLTPLTGPLGPRSPWVVPPPESAERERRLRQALQDEAHIRVHLVLVMWYCLAGLTGVSLGLMAGALALDTLQWFAIVERLERRRDGRAPPAG